MREHNSNYSCDPVNWLVQDLHYLDHGWWRWAIPAKWKPVLPPFVGSVDWPDDPARLESKKNWSL